MTGSPEDSPEGRLSSLPNEMRTNLGLLDVGSTWLPFPPEVDANILTDLLLERNGSRKLNFRFTEFSEGRLTAYLGTTATASISTKKSGCARPQTNTPVMAGGFGVSGQAF
jgi:hypothetical protein